MKAIKRAIYTMFCKRRIKINKIAITKGLRLESDTYVYVCFSRNRKKRGKNKCLAICTNLYSLITWLETGFWLEIKKENVEKLSSLPCYLMMKSKE